MVSSRLIRLFFLCTQILLLIINVNFTQALLGPRDVPIFHCSNNKGNYTTGSTYQTNLNGLLFDLHSYNNGYGFFNSSRGENIDRVYAIVLCRGLIKEDICSKCLTDAANYLREHCTNQEATGWQNDCMLRYSNRSLYGMMETNPDLYLKDVETLSVSTGLDAFSQESSHLLNRLGQKAATGGDLRKFATGNASLPSSDITIYGLVQCTPELSEQSCIDCLNYTFGMFGSCCSVSVGVRIVKPSCGSRYEIYPFLNDTTETPPANTASPGGKKSNTSQTVIITVVTVVISLVLIILICIYFESEEDEGKTWSFWFHIASLSCKEADEILDTEALQFDLGSIRTATNNFSEANKLGRGGFGAVYRSNVNSFGVLILEIVTGQKNSSFRHSGNVEDLLSYAWKSWKEDTASNLIDPMLKSGSIPETMRCIHIGLLCVQQNIADRPTMAAVIHMLTSYSLDLPVPSQPAFFIVGSDVTAVQGLNQSRSSSIQQSVNEVSITELSPRVMEHLRWEDNSGVKRLDWSKSNYVQKLPH
ncbi:hypothetical protein DVH24_021042 [Malus domestica]|uniref:Gnk2-homologous domain-containing protein n=1 Tax=Malus domestica TaxID=3750 RepID=A0A498J8A7_MALDO|nr:hypothetical protein DVH24_021042 [Malus domestica]